jgi:hypothetical protein
LFPLKSFYRRLMNLSWSTVFVAYGIWNSVDTILFTKRVMFRVMVFMVTFNNILVISWRSVLLEYPMETTDLPQVTDKSYHMMLYRIYLSMNWIDVNGFFNHYCLNFISIATLRSTKISISYWMWCAILDIWNCFPSVERGRRCRDRMTVGFITTNAMQSMPIKLWDSIQFMERYIRYSIMW